MKRIAIAALWLGGLGGCNLYFGGGGAVDDQPPPPGDDVPYIPPDAATSLPDAQGPVRFVWWSTRSNVTPDQACAPYVLASTATSPPSLGPELVLSTSGDESITYSQSDAALNPIVTDTGFVEGTFRVQSGSAGYHFTYNGLTDGVIVNGNGSAVTDGGTIFTADAAHAHAYQLRAHLWTGEVDVSVDGVALFTEHALTAAPDATSSVTWGAFAGTPGNSSWTEFAHDLHADSLCPLP